MLVFDIETGPLPDEELATIVEPFDEASVPHPGEFCESAVKLGNIKDPAKVAERIAAAREAHAQDCANHSANVAAAREAYWRGIRNKAALSPATGRVIAIGLHRSDINKSAIVDASDEAETMRGFWTKYSQCRQSNCAMVGFNVFGFDLPFLVRRSWILGVDVPSTILSQGRYWDTVFVDLMQVWNCGQYGKFESLDVVSRVLGCGQKNGNGADFAALWQTDRNAANAYLLNDLAITAGVAAKLGVI